MSNNNEMLERIEMLEESIMKQLENDCNSKTKIAKLNTYDTDNRIVANLITVLASKDEKGVITIYVITPTVDGIIETTEEGDNLRTNISIIIKTTYMRHLVKEREEMMKKLASIVKTGKVS